MTYINAMKLYPYDSIERKKYMRDTFKKYIASILLYIKTNELNIKTAPFAYVFEHIKNNILDIISLFVPPEEKSYISSKNWNDIKSAIIRDLSKGNFLSSKSSDTSIKYKYYVIVIIFTVIITISVCVKDGYKYKTCQNMPKYDRQKRKPDHNPFIRIRCAIYR